MGCGARSRLTVAQKKDLLGQGRKRPWQKTILGSPQSKANSRKLVLVKGRPLFIKSDAARAYLDLFLKQCPILDPMFEDDVEIRIDIYYSSRRPDVDESLIMDAMQGRIYRNDRQIRRKVIEGFVDKDNPRACITVLPYTSITAEEPEPIGE